MELTHLLQQAEAQCATQQATLAPQSVEARRASSAIAQALAFLTG